MGSGDEDLRAAIPKSELRIREIALLLFVAQWKASFTNLQVAQEWDPERVYRNCVKNAMVVVLIEGEGL